MHGVAASPVNEVASSARGAGAATVVAAVMLVLAVVVGGLWPVTLAITVVCVVVAALGRSRGSRSIAVLVLCLLAATWLLRLPGWSLWPLPLVLAAGVYVLLTRTTSWGLVDDWFTRGRIDRRGVLLTVAIVPVSAAALVVWASVVGQDGSGQEAYRELVASRGPLVLALAGLGFALVNAAAEELVYNGVAQRSMHLHLRPVVAVVLTACVFGASHWFGFPSGWSGVVLAGVYGFLLSVLRHVSGGLLLPWVAHVLADVTIVAILASLWS